MPIYEYECQKCGEHFEVTQRIIDDPLKKHTQGTKCGGKLSKLMSSNAFHLKGTGWYKTDYADKKEPTASAPDEKKESSDTPKKNADKKAEKKKITKKEPSKVTS